ncbi:DUF551 domain-containing protein [Klebsiella variicola]|uniref:DUF551 domain-containing protein n=1 Tax=Klebsiella variicola TaxID=244366 RepID=UPI0038D2481E
MTSKLTRERLQEIAEDGFLKHGESKELARMALAAMDSEPVAVVEPSDYVTAAQLVGEGPARKAVHELYEGALRIGDKLYRHAQPAPVVPEVLQNLRTIVADPRRLPRRKEWIGGQQYSYVLLEEVEALVEDACRAAMLASAPQSPGSETAAVPGKWIPVSERMPESNGVYFGWDGKRVLEVICFFGGFSANQFIHGEITHWMPLPAPPTEVK